MKMSFKGAWGYAPLLVTLANAGEVFYLVNRPGNAPQPPGRRGLDRPRGPVREPDLCARGHRLRVDAGCGRWADRVDVVLDTDSTAALLGRAEALDEQAWQRLTRPAPYANRIGRTRTRRRKKCWHACRLVAL
jgi:hypothetical protein